MPSEVLLTSKLGSSLGGVWNNKSQDDGCAPHNRRLLFNCTTFYYI